jgi:hypothetical protein
VTTRPLFSALLLLALAGCGGGCCDEPSPDNHGYGWQFDAESRNGLRLRQAGATTRDADFLELIASSVEGCSKIEHAPPPPFVVVAPPDSLKDVGGRTQFGLYFSAPPLIVLDEARLFIAYPHETLHYLLDATTGNPDAEHHHTAFSTCVFSSPH